MSMQNCILFQFVWMAIHFEKKFLNSFIEKIDIYPEEQPDGRIIRHIRFKFPVWFGEGYTSDLSWDNETTVSTCLGTAGSIKLLVFDPLIHYDEGMAIPRQVRVETVS